MAPHTGMASLKGMAQNIRQKGPADKKPTSSGAPTTSEKSKKFVEDSSDSSSGSESGSDSDSDDKIEAERQKLAAKKQAATAGSKANGAPKGKNRTTNAQASKIVKGGSTSASTSDSETDSDSESEEEQPAPKPIKIIETKVAAKKEEPSDESSGSDSESEDDDEGAGAGATVAPTQKSQPSAKAIASAKPAVPAKNVERSSSEDSDSSSEDEVEPKAVAGVNGSLATKQNSEVSRPAWLENSDFLLRKASSDNPGKEVSDFMSKANLEGKQVWYFTAPSSLPVTVLKEMEIDMAKATAGGAIITHKGDAYGMDLEPYATSTEVQILIANKPGEKTAAINRTIDSTFHIRREAKFGGDSNVKSAATDDYLRKPKPIREQPQGLKPRFTAIGIPNAKPAPIPKPVAASKSKPTESESESESDSDEEMADAPAATAKAHTNGALKRKQPADEESSEDESSEDEPTKTSQPTKTAKRTNTTESQQPNTSTPKSSQASAAPKSAVKAAGVKSTPASKKGKKTTTHVPPPKQTPIPVPPLPRTGSGN